MVWSGHGWASPTWSVGGIYKTGARAALCVSFLLFIVNRSYTLYPPPTVVAQSESVILLS